MKGNDEHLVCREPIPQSPRLSEVFHMLNRMIPDNQVVFAVSPETTARAALELMNQRGFSQLPVQEGEHVLGLFTYRAFALEVAQSGKTKEDIASLPVEEFLEHEKPSYARVTDEFSALIAALNAKDAVVVSSPETLIAIITPMDVLQYLYTVTSPFVLIAEIELALRALMSVALPNEAIVGECAANALANKYRDRKMPTRMEDMTFDDYISLIRHGDNWSRFRDILGGTRERAQARLEPVRNLRNDVFHFRRELSVQDHEILTTCRAWLLLRCTRKVQARSEGVN